MHKYLWCLALAACAQPEPAPVDNDNDGAFADQDCDDDDSSAFPGAVEVCDGVDNNCNSEIDEEAIDRRSYWSDNDGDGWGAPDSEVLACDPPANFVERSGDCDDDEPGVHPDAIERCSGVDDNCDGRADEGAAQGASVWYLDVDRDGFAGPSNTLTRCERPDGYLAEASDCDDADDAIHPGADERCDGLDNDCDGVTDGPDAIDRATWHLDGDDDGFGDPESAVQSCDSPIGHVFNSDDCDDGNGEVHPGATEVCNAIDDDCDGTTDGPESSDAREWFADVDLDGFGAPSSPQLACAQPTGKIEDDQDCDDSNAKINPDADELCNETDDDCDGSVDEDAIDKTTSYRDADGDGFGLKSAPMEACDIPYGHVEDDEDCDDSNDRVNPDAEEVCNSIDDDCDGTTDVEAVDASTWYHDKDGDKYGDPASSKSACFAPKGYLTNALDCDDTDKTVHPYATELCDGVDSDCDGKEATQIVSFYPKTGGVTSMTVAAAGTASKPKTITLSSAGTLRFCDGLFHTRVKVDKAVDVTVESLNGAGNTVLRKGYIVHEGTDGGPEPQPHTLTVRDLTLWDTLSSDGVVFNQRGHVSARDLVLLDVSGGTRRPEIGTDTGDLTIDGLRVIDARAGWGAIGSTSGDVSASDVYLLGTYGRSIRNDSGDTTLSYVTIEDTAAGCFGQSTGALTADHLSISGCGGTAIALGSGDADLSDVTLKDNDNKGITTGNGTVTIDGMTSSEAGGGVTCLGLSGDRGSLDIANLTSTDSVGLGINYCDTQLTDVKFTDRGGVSVAYSDLDATRVTLKDGGSLRLSRGTFNLRDLTVTGSTSAIDGGAIYSLYSTLSLTNCVLDGNEARDEGGALYLHRVVASLKSCRIEKNRTKQSGGGIALYDRSKVTMDGTIVRDNTSRFGGGATIGGSSTLSCNGDAKTTAGFHSNVASASAGGVWVKSGTLTATSCDFGPASTITDNRPEDVYLDYSTKGAYSDDATFMCTTNYPRGCK